MKRLYILSCAALLAFLLANNAPAWPYGSPAQRDASQAPSTDKGYASIAPTQVVGPDGANTLSNSNRTTAAGLYATLPLSGAFTNGVWQVEFTTIGSNNLYILERSTDLLVWMPVASAVSSSAQRMFLRDTSPPFTRGFYRVRANSSNPSKQPDASALSFEQTGQTWAHVQTEARNSASVSNALAFSAPTGKGNLIIVEVDWPASNRFVSLSDSQANVYTQIGAEQKSSSIGVKSRLYYARNIRGGADTVTTVLSGIPSYHEVFIHEYSGLSTTAPFDGYSVNTGVGSSYTSRSLTTKAPNDLLYGVEIDSGTGTASSGWTTRSTLDGDVAADKNLPLAGKAGFTGTSSGASLAWIVAFRAADTLPPRVPTNLTAVAVSSSQINLSWTASTDDVGVAGYKVFRNGAQIATPSSTSFSDVGLAPGTTYTYTVSAFDAAGNVSAQSSPASASTQAVPAPVINSFSARPASITAGQTATLSWSVSNATSLELDNGIGNVTGTNAAVVNPSATVTYTLTATSGGGSAAAQTTVTVNEAPDVTPPGVSITSPDSGATVSGTAVTISASASDPVIEGHVTSGVAGVQFRLDGQAVGSEVVSAPYSLVWDTTKAPNGSHILSAVARDAAGNTVTSATVAVTVTNAARTYTTTFTNTEDPISEGGNWINGGVGLDWSNCATVGGMVQGRQNNGNGPSYNDSTALLSGTWGSNQDVTVTLYRGNVVENDWPEAEIRLRSSLSAHSCTGYEVTWSLLTDSSCYVAITRWNGPFGDFTGLSSVSGSQYVVTNGSILRATIIGSTITASINGISVLTATDTTYSTGNPGVGFDHNGPSSDDAGFGFTSFSATSDAGGASDTNAPSTPTGLSATAVSSSQINLSWAASTDNVGVTGYRILRDGAQIATPAATSFSDVGLAPGTTYTYSVSAFDAAGNVSAESSTASATTPTQTAQSWAHVQTNARNSAGPTNALAFGAATRTGDLIIVEVDWLLGSAFVSLSDSQGNTYTEIGAEETSSAIGVKSRLYYAKNISGGATTITTVISGASAYHELYIHEYSGLSTTNPLDAYSVNVASNTSFTSGTVTTTVTNELLYGFEVDYNAGAASPGWTTRSALDGNVAADENKPTPGNAAFTGTSSGASLAWIAAFK